MELRFEHVTFAYETAPMPVLTAMTAHFPRGWTGVAGANGTGKTTILRLACGALSPQTGSVQIPGMAVYCPQRTDEPPPGLERFLGESDSEAYTLRGRLGIEADWLRRWNTLSHGERKRAQIGVALWQTPELLAVDEPTNHLDREARELVGNALASFTGIGLLVSHDRELLDRLCRRTLILSAGRVVLRPGSYSAAVREEEREDETARRERRNARRAVDRLNREMQRRQQEAARSDARTSKRHLKRGDSDGRDKIDAARVSGKDGQAGRLANQLSRRVERSERALEDTRAPKEYRLGIWFAGSRSPGDALFHVPAGELPLGANRRLVFPELYMNPTDRVALTGPNGAGKSTLIAHLLAHLSFDSRHLTYMPQEIPLEAAEKLMAEVGQLSTEARGDILTIVSRLGSRPHRLIDNLEPSPGEIRKVLLALGLTREPYLIVMDEPTNHLDLPAIECLERALEECPCGLFLVSHDRVFLRRLCRRGWNIRASGHGADMELVETEVGLR